MEAEDEVEYQSYAHFFGQHGSLKDEVDAMSYDDCVRTLEQVIVTTCMDTKDIVRYILIYGRLFDHNISDRTEERNAFMEMTEDERDVAALAASRRIYPRGRRAQDDYDRKKLLMNVLAAMDIYAQNSSDVCVSDGFLRVLTEDIRREMNCILTSYDLMTATRVLQSHTADTGTSRLRMCGMREYMQHEDMREMSPEQIMTQSMLRHAFSLGLRKARPRNDKDINVMLYKPKMIIYDGVEVYSGVYEEYMPIQEFIWTIFEIDRDLKMGMTRHGLTIMQCVKYMRNTRESALPYIEYHRTQWAFSNGVYDARNRRFHCHGEMEGASTMQTFDHAKSCIHYIDKPFEYDVYVREKEAGGGYSAVETPTAEKVMLDQKWSPAVQVWLYILLYGRMMFPGGTDNWQVYPLLQGSAGTGKSTFLTLLEKFYPLDMVGQINAQGRENFPLQSVYDKCIITCMECGKVKLPEEIFNQMVSNENLSVSVLLKDKDVSKRWDVLLAMAGNSPPPFANIGDSIGRRSIVFRFLKYIDKADTSLPKRLEDEMPRILFKGTNMYLDALERYKGKSLWRGFKTPKSRGGRRMRRVKPILPKEIHDNRRYIQARGNPLAGMIYDDAYIERGDGPEFHVSAND
ncbi:MAG: hypothetical protein CMK92_02235, partial [Pseudomonas sp.]|nr:hypothetical protein [Pseudomonas sp.]